VHSAVPRVDAVPWRGAFITGDERAARPVRAVDGAVRIHAAVRAFAPAASDPADAPAVDPTSAEPVHARPGVSAGRFESVSSEHVADVRTGGAPHSASSVVAAAGTLIDLDRRDLPIAHAPRSLPERRGFGLSLALVAACGGDGLPPSRLPPPPGANEPPSLVPASPDSIPVAAAASASAAPVDAPSERFETKHDAAWAASHDSFKQKGTPSVTVDALSRGCAKATGLKKWGETIVAERAATGGAPASYPLLAKGAHCYRVFGRGDQGVKDLDVAIVDSAGAIAAEDVTDSPTAVVVADGAVCFKSDDAATVAVRVESGKGKYAIQIWSDE
jgi:hypothetical protein